MDEEASFAKRRIFSSVRVCERNQGDHCDRPGIITACHEESVHPCHSERSEESDGSRVDQMGASDSKRSEE